MLSEALLIERHSLLCHILSLLLLLAHDQPLFGRLSTLSIALLLLVEEHIINLLQESLLIDALSATRHLLLSFVQKGLLVSRKLLAIHLTHKLAVLGGRRSE